MKLVSGVAVIGLGLLISAVAAYFSIVGLAALFAGAAIPVIVMGSSLESGKLLSAAWLHSNWHNKNVTVLHKAYLTIAVIVLMLITALGIYGFLARGHLEQEAPLAGIELKISGIEQQIGQIQAEKRSLATRQEMLDKSLNTIMGTAKTAKQAHAAGKAGEAQTKERNKISSEIAEKSAVINKLTDELVPLKLKTADVSAKLGPVRYVAQLVGWKDPTSAVQAIIILIMIAFDPLAVMMVLSGTITIGEWNAERARRKGSTAPVATTLQTIPVAAMTPPLTFPSAPPLVLPLTPPLMPEGISSEPVIPQPEPELPSWREPVPIAPRPVVEPAPPIQVQGTIVPGAYGAMSGSATLGGITMDGARVIPVPAPVDEFTSLRPHTGASVAAEPNGPMPNPHDAGWLTVPRFFHKRPN